MTDFTAEELLMIYPDAEQVGEIADSFRLGISLEVFSEIILTPCEGGYMGAFVFHIDYRQGRRTTHVVPLATDEIARFVSALSKATTEYQVRCSLAIYGDRVQEF